MAREYDEALLEPLKYYREHLKDTFYQVTADYFEQLVNQSNVDIDKNKELIDRYEAISKDRNQANSKYKRFTWVRNADCLVGVGSLIYGVYQFLQNTVDVIHVSISVILLLFSIGIYFYWIKPQINSLKEILDRLDVVLSQMRDEGYEMMKPLNELFHSEMTTELIRKAIPFIHLDTNFNIKRYEQLVKNYGFLEKYDENHSTLDIASGDILGNPFVFIKRINHWIDDYTYEGRRTVSYTVQYRDSNGKLCSKRVSETLYATIKQPGPYYSNEVSLVYGNDAAPNLTFYREPVEKGILDWVSGKLQLQNKIFSIRNKAKESLKDGGTFQALSNEEFDAQFNALNRDHEVEFRLLFTPLAQTNYKDIFENSPYGDDFIFNKALKINEVQAGNAQNWDFDTTPSQYVDFSFESIKEKFISFNCKYFEHMYFSFLPLLAIPLYQQMASNDYIYSKSYDFQYNDYMTEMMANKLDIDLFVPADATDKKNVKTILKTSHYKVEGESEIIKVDAHSYKTVSHTDYIPVRAGDGRLYDVPVQWDEYIPVMREELMEVSELKCEENNFDHIRDLNFYQKSEHNQDGSFAYKNFMVGKLYRDNQSLEDLLSNIYKQYGGNRNG